MSENNAAVQGDSIELSLPLNAAYLAAARLTASSIANRIGFDAEEIEDVKVAVGEACAFMIRQASPKAEDQSCFKVAIKVLGEMMSITLSCDLAINSSDSDSDMGLMMIKALMDTTVVDAGDEQTTIVLTKKHKVNVFE